jgi:predicted nuclease of predicted toxin-antitoxin system
MIIWVDVHISPVLVPWLARTFGVEAAAVRDLGLREADDDVIFEAARAATAVVRTKDRDFVELLERLGPPPQVICLTCGNTSNRALRALLAAALPDALGMLAEGDPLVEIRQAE